MSLRPSRLLLVLIRGYQRAISPLLPPSCRYAPTCSQYAIEAIAGHGALRGSWLALKRLGRCHPGRAGGYDPVPARQSAQHAPQTDPGGEGPRSDRRSDDLRSSAKAS